MKHSLFRSPAELLKELEGDVSDTLVRSEDIPCIETSDKEQLCKAPLISVRMVTYNHEKWIAEAIEGVVKQKTDFEFELIIGEDCSTDRTREICFEYQKKYPHIIRVMWSKTNVGGNQNGRRCLIRSRGEYQALCEGDDFWTDPLKLQKQVDLIRQTDAVMCVAFHRNRYLDGTEADGDEIACTPLGKQFLAADDFLKAYFHTSTYVYRVDAYWQTRKSYPDIQKWYDIIVCQGLASMGKVVLLPEIVSMYRITGEGIATSLNEQQGAILGLRQYLSLYLYGPTKNRKQFGLRIMHLIGVVANSFCDGWSREEFKKVTRGFVLHQVYLQMLPTRGATKLLMVYYLVRFRFLYKLWNFLHGRPLPSHIDMWQSKPHKA